MSDAERLNFSVVLPGRLAGLGWPFPHRVPADAPALLRQEGVAVLANLTGYAYAEEERALLQGIDLLDLPIEDYAPPEPEIADRLWEVLQELPEGKLLAVHCAAGIGRTGTLLACLLGRLRGMDGPAAVAALRQLRPGSVETLAQERFVDDWLSSR